MFIIDNYFLAIVFCVITMLCWGSWGNTQKLASKRWAFQLFYWDYAFGILVFSLLMAFTMGSIGSGGRHFIDDITQASGGAMLDSFIGGVVFNFANILLVIAINIAGLAVAFPVGIGLALVIGVFVNYIADPQGDPLFLFAGVALIVVAIIVSALTSRQITDESKSKDMVKGLGISVIAGIAMGFFYRFVASSMSMNFSMPEAGLMTPYSALVVFSVGIVVSNFVFNTINMYKPIGGGSPVTYRDYFKQGDTRLHLIGMLGGAIWCFGMLSSIISAEMASPAVSYGLGQGATMVSAAWGVFIWKEFRNAKNKRLTNTLLSLMFASFIAGLAMIIIAKL